jgi:hypothetical protein
MLNTKIVPLEKSQEEQKDLITATDGLRRKCNEARFGSFGPCTVNFVACILHQGVVFPLFQNTFIAPIIYTYICVCILYYMAADIKPLHITCNKPPLLQARRPLDPKSLSLIATQFSIPQHLPR